MHKLVCICSMTVNASCMSNSDIFTSFNPNIQVTGLLNKMQLSAKQSIAKDGQCSIIVSVPPTRSDVLHPCDVMEVLILISVDIGLWIFRVSILLTFSHMCFYWEYLFFYLRMLQLLMGTMKFQREILHLWGHCLWTNSAILSEWRYG